MKQLGCKTPRIRDFSVIIKTFFVLCVAFLLTLPVRSQTDTKSFVEMIYWSEDKNKCPICHYRTIEGTQYFIFKTPELELFFSGNFYKELFWASVFLENRSESRVELDISQSVLAVYKKKGDKIPFEIYSIAPEQAAKKARGNSSLRSFISTSNANLAVHTEQANSSKTGDADFSFRSSKNPVQDLNEKPIGTEMASDQQPMIVERRNIEVEKHTSMESGQQQIIDAALRTGIVLPKKAIGGNIYFSSAKGIYMFIGIRIGGKLYVKGFSGVKENRLKN